MSYGPRAVVKDLNFFYGTHQVLKNINLSVAKNRVTALIGPSGCGKTTLLRCFNRMHDNNPLARYEGAIELNPEGVNLLGMNVDPITVRMRIGMVFQKPNPFPKSIFENVVYGLRVRGVRNRAMLNDQVEKSLKDVALWDEVKDRLQAPATALSGGQQQRLCMARALAVDPEVILFDEPTSALDPIATGRVEELFSELRKKVTIVIVTHNMQQAQRVADYTAFMYLGEMVEFGDTKEVFENPQHQLTREYLSGHFG